jgi:hypothetical protein
VIVNLNQEIRSPNISGSFANVNASTSLSSASTSASASVIAKLVVKSHGEWPIPEAFYVDKSIENLPIRTAHPVFTLDRNITQAPQVGQSSVSFNSNITASCMAELQLLKELDIRVDTYELSLAGVGTLKIGFHKKHFHIILILKYAFSHI